VAGPGPWAAELVVALVAPTGVQVGPRAGGWGSEAGWSRGNRKWRGNQSGWREVGRLDSLVQVGVTAPFPTYVRCGSTAVARLSTKKKPHMSVTVVRIGPEASAGSMSMRLSASGISPPRLTATIVFTINAAPTTAPSHGLPF